jgi:hypothetical protein
LIGVKSGIFRFSFRAVSAFTTSGAEIGRNTPRIFSAFQKAATMRGAQI